LVLQDRAVANRTYNPMLRTILASSRYLILIAVLGSFLAAAILLIYGGLEVLQLMGETVAAGAVNSKGAKTLSLAFIEVVDVFLLGTIFYIVALGLYELFIEEGVGLPPWLVIRDLDDLKDKLIGVVIVVLGVLFLGQVVTWDGQRDLLRFGVAVALVIAALTYFLGQRAKKDKGEV
jgi:uncharacterized membrane protein YqhA